MTVGIADRESMPWTGSNWPGKVANGEPDVQYKAFNLGRGRYRAGNWWSTSPDMWNRPIATPRAS